MRLRTKYLSICLLTTLLVNTVLSMVSPLSLAAAAEASRKQLNVTKTLTAPVIDGKLDESFWSLEETLEVPQGEGLSTPAKLGLLWDNQYLYIGMEMKDDVLMSDAAGAWFEQDGVSMFFDPGLHQSAPFQSSDMQAGFVYRSDKTTPQFHFGAALNNHNAKDEKDLLRAIQTTDHGWSLEVAVPWSMLEMDPVLQKQLGFEATATDRYGSDAADQRVSAWSAYQSSSFWNDTQGYGILTLTDDHPVSGVVNPVLLEENFDAYGTGEIPYGWITDESGGNAPFSVVQDTYGNGRMTFAGTEANKQGRISAPIQWDNYTVEADVRFDSVLNSTRWAALMFRGASDGKAPYNQMAIRQDGTYEVAYRKPDNSWSVIASGPSEALELGKDYRFKVRVFENNVKEYIKPTDEEEYKLLVDQSFASDLLARGKVGFQADQSTVSFDNLKVTRITADELHLSTPNSVEALTGPLSVTGSVYYSDGLTDPLEPQSLRFYSSDESIMKVNGDKVYPVKEGTVVLTAVYANAEWSASITVTPSSKGVSVNSLSHEAGYVLVETGRELDLDGVELEAKFNDFSEGTVTGAELEWASSDSEILINDGKLIAQRKGVFTVVGQRDKATVKLIIVAKEKGDAEYVLYENNFDNEAEGELPVGWTRIEGSTKDKAAVKSGAFVIQASSSPDNPTRVLLPEYLQLFGDYKIEADVTHLAANDPARWHSIMYRIQDPQVGGYPYYQMAVRQNATAVNGVEFAERTPSNEWNVINKGSFTETINPDKMYHYTIAAFGDRVMESIGDEVLINTANAGTYLKGGIGLQANGSVMKVDNLRITLQQEELPPLPEDRFVSITETDTEIALAPSIITELESVSQLNGFKDSHLPATLFIYVDHNLNVTTSGSGKVIMSLQDALAQIGTDMIPAFYIKDEQTVTALTEYLKSIDLEDAFIVSDQPDLVKKGREAYTMIRGIVDFSGMNVANDEELMDLRKQATLSKAKIVILSQAAATKNNVAYLQQRTMMVWAKEGKAAGNEATNVNLHRLITAGVNGIITQSPDEAQQALKVYSHNPTLIRKPYIIGHRGMPSVAPENTIISNKLALDAGADFIENDIYLSKDGHLVIIHDSVVDTTTYGTGLVENMTLEELQKLKVKQVPGTDYPEARIATLAEQIDLARERGAMIYAEIKTSTPAAVDAFVKLVKEKDAEDLINVMSFNTNHLDRLAELLPDMPLGLLTGGYANENRVNGALRETLKVMQQYNSTLNTSYGGLGPKFMEAAHHRGLIISPWTYNNYDDFKSIFMLGVFGITTDYAFWAKDWNIVLEPEQKKITLKAGESTQLSAIVESYSHNQKTISPEIVLLDDSGVVMLDETGDGQITAKKPGETYALLRYTASLDADNVYDLYTEPVLIKVSGEDNGGGSNGGEGNGNGNGNNGNNGNNNNGNNNNSSSNGGQNNGSDDNGSGSSSNSVDNSGSTTSLPVFTDVANHWASGSIQRLVEQGILNGYADGTYKPNSTVSRAEFTAIIYRFLGFDETTNNVSSFKDIEANAWYALYVNKLQQAGVINGFSDGTFRPDQMISREEAMVILYRVLKDDLVQSDKVDLGFMDKDYISSWAIEAIQALTSTGVISGYPDGTIKPKANITRGETAAIIAQLIK